jgi:epoxyqueuosine reductase QueG
MSNISIEIEQQLKNEHVDFVHFVDISMLGIKQNRGFPFATSALPHKTIAILSGIGYIGKSNLFITEEFGAAQCLGSVYRNL